MRARYQSKPRVAAFGIMLSLGLIFGAHEVMQASQVTEQEEAAAVDRDVVAPMGAATLEMGVGEAGSSGDEPTLLDRSC